MSGSAAKAIHVKNRRARKLQAAVVVCLLAAVGIYFLATSQAAPAVASAQPETGSLSAGATIINDTAASGAKGVRFAAADVPEPGGGSASTTVIIDGIKYPNPLRLNNGNAVTSSRMWETSRRAELLADFHKHIYGKPLPAPTKQSFSVTTKTLPTAIYKRVNISVTGPYGSATIPLRLYLPKTGKPKGTHLRIDIVPEKAEGDLVPRETFPVDRLLAQGYAAALIDTDTIAIDGSSYRGKVINLFHKSSEPLPKDAGRTISAWAWGASRAMDYLQTDPDIDPAKVSVHGHSRGGKAALLAGAQDTRFVAVISNNSGSTGAKLARRSSIGQDVKQINGWFPHWFAENYRTYNDNESALPVDQHELIALVAPRKAYIISASRDGAADPQGEFLGLMGAAPVYKLYGLGSNSLTAGSWRPTLNKLYPGSGMNYHIRDGVHGMTDIDWKLIVESRLFSE